MKLKAKKSFHTSGIGTVHQGATFEAHDALGKELSDKGLAEVLEASTDTDAGAAESAPHAKQEPPPLNKMEQEPSPKTKRRRERAAEREIDEPAPLPPMSQSSFAPTPDDL